MAGLFRKKLNGVSVGHHKHTKGHETETMPVPDQIHLAMSQHMGPSCEVQVQVGDQVRVGQVIGDSPAAFGVPIHSGVSGKVARIEEIQLPNGNRSKTVVIQADKEQLEVEGLAPPVVESREDFVAAVRASGVVGLGGAGFPTHIKLNPKNAIEHLVINAAECEPYITSDYRTLLEDAEAALYGISTIMKYLEIPNCVVGIEDNKPEAISRWKDMLADRPEITVKPLESRYPQGAEKMLIFETTGRIVPEGKLPSDVSVIVVNITTAACLAEYLQTGRPLTTKRITVDGGAISQPKNIRAIVGTPIREIVAFCGGYKSEPSRILLGGPMMGAAIYDDGYPVMKNCNAILFFDASEGETDPETPCIRCGRCVRTCPMNLMPLRLNDCFEQNDDEGLKRYKVNLCIECGCCSFICPAKRHLVHNHRLAKARLRAAAAKERGA